MSTTAHEVFVEAVRTLPPNERLQLATLILQDLAQSTVLVVDKSDEWNDQDQTDITSFSLQYATQCYPETEELA